MKISTKGRPYYGGGRAKGQLNAPGKRNRIEAIERLAANRAKIAAVQLECERLVKGLLAGAVTIEALYDASGDYILVDRGVELTSELLNALPPELLKMCPVSIAIESAVLEAYAQANRTILELKLYNKRPDAIRPFGR